MIDEAILRRVLYARPRAVETAFVLAVVLAVTLILVAPAGAPRSLGMFALGATWGWAATTLLHRHLHEMALRLVKEAVHLPAPDCTCDRPA